MKTIFNKKDPEVIAFAFANALGVFVAKFEEETLATATNLTAAYHTIRSERSNTSSKTGQDFTNSKSPTIMENSQEEAVEAQEKAPKAIKAIKVAKEPKAPKEPKAIKEPKAVKEPKAPKEPKEKKNIKADYIKTLLLQGKTPNEVCTQLKEEDIKVYYSEVSSCVARLVKLGKMAAPVKASRATKNPKGFVDLTHETEGESEDQAEQEEDVADSEGSEHVHNEVLEEVEA